MKITVIHGSPRKGNTYRAAGTFLEALKKRGPLEIIEFFLPQDLPQFCRGCFTCFLQGEDRCPHAQYTLPVLKAMREADALLLTSPVYVMSASGGMKNFLDHFAFLFINHRPLPEFFHKKAFLISTAAGGGLKSAMKPIADSLKYWGINRTYQKGLRLFELNWDDMPEKKRKKLERQLDRCAEKFWRAVQKKDSAPTLFFQFYFRFCRWMHRKKMDTPCDQQYWKARGWLDGGNPLR